MTASLVAAVAISAAAEGGEHGGNVMLETFPYGLIAFAVFTFLAIISLSYRNVANRHSAKAAAYARAHENDVVRPGHGH